MLAGSIWFRWHSFGVSKLSKAMNNRSGLGAGRSCPEVDSFQQLSQIASLRLFPSP